MIYLYLFIAGSIAGICLMLLYLQSKEIGDKYLYNSLIFFSTIAANIPIVSVKEFYMGGAYPALELWIIDIPLLLLLIRSIKIKQGIKYTNKVLFIYLLIITWEIFNIFISPLKANAFFQVVQTIKGGILIYLLSGYLNKKNKIVIAVKVLGITVVFHSIFGVIQWINQGPIGLSVLGEFLPKSRHMNFLSESSLFGYNFGKYVSGLTGVPTCLTSIIIMYGSIALSKLIIVDKSKLKSILFFLISTFAVLLTSTRSGWVGWAVSLFLFFSYLLFFSKRQKLWIKISFVGAAAFFIALVFPIINNAFAERSVSSSAYSRILLVKIYYDLFLQNPILGVGLNNSVQIMANQAAGIFRYSPQPVHNLFFLYLVEAGIVGSILLITFFTRIVKLCRKGVTNNNNPLSKAIFLGAGCGIIGLIAQMQLTWTFRYPTVFYSFCILISIVIANNKILAKNL